MASVAGQTIAGRSEGRMVGRAVGRGLKWSLAEAARHFWRKARKSMEIWRNFHKFRENSRNFHEISGTEQIDSDLPKVQRNARTRSELRIRRI